jgi:hypothetical protein
MSDAFVGLLLIIRKCMVQTAKYIFFCFKVTNELISGSKLVPVACYGTTVHYHLHKNPAIRAFQIYREICTQICHTFFYSNTVIRLSKLN